MAPASQKSAVAAAEPEKAEAEAVEEAPKAEPDADQNGVRDFEEPVARILDEQEELEAEVDHFTGQADAE